MEVWRVFTQDEAEVAIRPIDGCDGAGMVCDQHIIDGEDGVSQPQLPNANAAWLQPDDYDACAAVDTVCYSDPNGKVAGYPLVDDKRTRGGNDDQADHRTAIDEIDALLRRAYKLTID